MSIAVAVSAFGIACLMTCQLTRASEWFQIVDLPNERSLHDAPIPRTGGLAIWAGGLTGWAMTSVLLGVRPELVWIAAAALVVGAISFLDDRHGISIGVRLGAHIIAAFLLLIAGLELEAIQTPSGDIDLPFMLALPLSALFIVWMINLYNFMDGMDGFAGGMALFGFGTLGILGYMAGDRYYALLCSAIAAAAAGFLVRNFPPARIFMGDTGSSVLGLMAAALSLLGDRLGLFPLWIGLLVFSPFVVDATVTLIQRASRRERIWRPHRSHYYQRLVQLGWGHRKTVLAEYVLMTACAVSAIGLLHASPDVRWAGVAAWGGVYAAILSAVNLECARRRRAAKSRNGRSDAA